MRSSGSVVTTRLMRSDSPGLPLMMAGLPLGRGRKANSSRSNRRGFFFGVRVASSGP